MAPLGWWILHVYGGHFPFMLIVLRTSVISEQAILHSEQMTKQLEESCDSPCRFPRVVIRSFKSSFPQRHRLARCVSYVYTVQQLYYPTFVHAAEHLKVRWVTMPSRSATRYQDHCQHSIIKSRRSFEKQEPLPRSLSHR